MHFSHTKHGDKLLNELIKSSSTVPLATLEERLSLSRRSIFYTIKKLNDELTNSRLDNIENIRGSGYRLTPECKQAIQGLSSNKMVVHSFTEFFNHHFIIQQLDQEKRVLLMTFFLISRRSTSLNQFSIIFNISKTTVIKYLGIISDVLPSSLQIINTRSGKIITGNELAIRRWVFENCSELIALLSPYLVLPHNSNYRSQLKLLERITGNSFTDDSLNILVNFIDWMIERIQKNQLTQIKYLPNKNDYSLTYTWAKSFLHDLGIDSDYEALFLEEIVSTQAFQHISKSNPMIPRLKPIAKQIIQNFNEAADVHLPINDDTLSKNLTIHLVPTYYRIKYKIRYHNPLVNQIKTSYRRTFDITKFATRPFSFFVNEKLSDDEIALIAVYFSGALRNLNIPSKNNASVMVICSSGIGTSELLISQLRNHYPNVNFVGPFNVFQFENASYKNVKLVMSTMDLPSIPENVPIVTVPVIPTNSDWERVDNYLLKAHLIKESDNKINATAIMDIVSNYARIVDPKGLEENLRKYINRAYNLTPQDTNIPRVAYSLNVFENEHDWQEATKLALTSLIYQGVINRSYIDAIINLTRKYGDYMAIGKGIYLAHATPSAGVKKLGFSYSYFKKPFRIDNSKKDINFIVGVAPIDQKQHLRILSNLLQFVQNDEQMQTLQRVRNTNDLEQLLTKANLIN